MDDRQLTDLYASLFGQYFPDKKKFEIIAGFTTRKSLRHTIERKSNSLLFKISPLFRNVPVDILNLLGLILLSKIFRIKLHTNIRKQYNQYVNEHILPDYDSRTRKPSEQYSAVGRFYDLNTIFDELNRRYFNSTLNKPILGWSLKDSYTRLGFYSRERNLLVISRIFDNRKTPSEIVCFLMYHEMLHIYFPVITIQGRRRIHSMEFRAKESAFPGYHSIQKWLKKKRFKL
ncbi:MAG: hypothetical protein JXR46_08935 [Calditrichaceae bacterium]|nr:hypothetical protein [Calditrichaceae bacterium]MBN2709156.1 hypothetical protein [Calditrichaceae bacterium]RQV96112.1 MAG: hypothetical protein EH224_05245 [Calditrichota bacterium]